MHRTIVSIIGMYRVLFWGFSCFYFRCVYVFLFFVSSFFFIPISGSLVRYTFFRKFIFNQCQPTEPANTCLLLRLFFLASVHCVSHECCLFINSIGFECDTRYAVRLESCRNVKMNESKGFDFKLNSLIRSNIPMATTITDHHYPISIDSMVTLILCTISYKITFYKNAIVYLDSNSRTNFHTTSHNICVKHKIFYNEKSNWVK